MNLKINSRHLEVTPAMRSHLEAGMAKIRKHFDHVIDASALSLIHISDKLERQVVKHKEKIQDHHHDKRFE